MKLSRRRKKKAIKKDNEGRPLRTLERNFIQWIFVLPPLTDADIEAAFAEANKELLK